MFRIFVHLVLVGSLLGESHFDFGSGESISEMNFLSQIVAVKLVSCPEAGRRFFFIFTKIRVFAQFWIENILYTIICERSKNVGLLNRVVIVAWCYLKHGLAACPKIKMERTNSLCHTAPFHDWSMIGFENIYKEKRLKLKGGILVWSRTILAAPDIARKLFTFKLGDYRLKCVRYSAVEIYTPLNRCLKRRLVLMPSGDIHLSFEGKPWSVSYSVQ